MATESRKSGDENVLGLTLWMLGIGALVLLIVWAVGLI